MQAGFFFIMQVKEVIIPYKYSDKIYLYPLGDIHLGTIHCAEEEIIDKVSEIKNNPTAYWIGMGDYAECITPSDKRWDPSQKVIPDWLKQDDIEDCQRKRVVNVLKPIKDKCIGLLYGNHEDVIRIRNHANIHKHICEDLGADNLGYSCLIHFLFRRKNSNESHLFKGAFTHGNGSARTEGGQLNYLKRFMDDFDAQIYGYAHVHTIKANSPESLSSNDACKIVSKCKVGAITGCWFRTYTQGEVASYGEKKVYKPTRIGCPRFFFLPSKGEIGVDLPSVVAL